MTVSIVVPTWNDSGGLQAICHALEGVACVSELIVVDDNSDEVLSNIIDTSCLERSGKQVTFIRQKTNKGGGAARNIGLSAVTNSYVLFLDSDDLPTENYDQILLSFLDHPKQFDFAMFRHIDSRELSRGNETGLPSDELYWHELPRSRNPLEMTSNQMAKMASVSAYPWNKLYRTGFLRDNSIKCTEIPVHNDIELHWASFMNARCVLYSHQTGVLHYVSDTGSRITNRKDKDRLRVFEALEEICQYIRTNNVPIAIQISFWRFFSKLMRWIPENLEVSLHSEFSLARDQFLLSNLSKAMFRQIAFTDPHLSTDILNLIRKGENS